jgi:N-acetylglucosaminyldiphosphoundecaprenol N-acetyl-beta-D-mannosaminyltransferase
MNVFGIPIEGLSQDSLLHRVQAASDPFWIVTANPEILLSCRSNKAYAHAVQQANTRTVDGFGLWVLLRLFGKKTERVTGVDLAEQMLKLASQKGWRVGFFGGSRWHSAEAAAEQMRKKYPGIQIVCEEGGKVTHDGEEDGLTEEARYRLMLHAPDVLLVALDHVKQEQWILKHLQDFPKVKCVMGVGGTFDYWSGVIHRAPKFFQMIGMEWLWRLIKEPRRIKRIFRAVIVFPILFLAEKF